MLTNTLLVQTIICRSVALTSVCVNGVAYIQKIFLLMSGGLFLAIIYCTVMALSVPYVLEHQERFKASVSPIGFAFSYLLDIVAILVAMISVRVRA